MQELEEAIKATKAGRAPGPDQVPPELLKWLPGEAYTDLLDFFNYCWNTEKVPGQWAQARV
eukprot:1764029-Alexandrium_andersonii.AAC.1